VRVNVRLWSGGAGVTEAQSNRDYVIQKMSNEIHEIIRVLQLTTYDEEEWDADDITVMKKAQVGIQLQLGLFATLMLHLASLPVLPAPLKLQHCGTLHVLLLHCYCLNANHDFHSVMPVCLISGVWSRSVRIFCAIFVFNTIRHVFLSVQANTSSDCQ